MSGPFLDWLLDMAVFPGLPVAALVIGGYQAIRHDRRWFCLVLNIAVMLALGIFAVVQPVDGAAPVPGIIVVMYMMFYVPLHLVLLGIVWGISFHRERRRNARLAGGSPDGPAV